MISIIIINASQHFDISEGVSRILPGKTFGACVGTVGGAVYVQC